MRRLAAAFVWLLLPAVVAAQVPPQNADVTGDGIVDSRDTAAVQASLLKRPGQPGFNPRADVNGDGVVNVSDANFVSRNLGARFPPTITATVSAAANANGWHSGSVTVSFTCTGVSSCPAPVDVSSDGGGQLVSRTISNAGGSATASVVLNIDTTAPTISVALAGNLENGIYTGPVTAHFTCGDTLSGIVSCPPDQIVSTPGANQTVSGTATDSAGNSASATSAPFTIVGSSTPTISVTLTPPANANGWNNTPVTAHFVCSDPVAGITFCPPDQTISTEGANQTVSGTTVNSAGVSASITSQPFSVDMTPPAVALSSPTIGNTGATVYTQSVTLSGTAADALSGIASATCEGTAAVITAGALRCVVTLVPGPNEVHAGVTDRAGNSSSASLVYTYIRVPLVTIAAPANLSYTTITPTTVTGTVDDPTATVTINSIEAPVVNGAFSIALPLSEGPNLLTATATTSAGASGTASLTVTLDTTPPHVTITSPPDQFVTTDASISVAGNVNDIVVGTVNAEQAGVSVNGAAAEVSNRTFLRTEVPLAIGPNVIQAVARDRVGNQATTEITVVREAANSARITLLSGNNQSAPIGAAAPAPLVVTVTDASGAPVAGKPVIFKVTQNDGLVAVGGVAPASSVVATTDGEGRAQVQWTLGNRAGAGGNSVEAYSVGFSGTAIFTASGTQGAAAQIVVDAGNDQIGAIGQSLPKPFIAVVVDGGHNRLANVPVTFSVQEGGGTFDDGATSLTVVSDPDGRVSATLTLGMQEGNANNIVGATFEGNTGFPAAFTASGRAPGDPAKTTITGVVLDNSNQPIPNVTVRAVSTYVLHSNLTSVQAATAVPTDAQGQFTIPQAPIGFVKLLVDGSTVQSQDTYPSLEYDLVTVAGQTNTVGQPIYLLPLNSANQLCVTATTGGGTLTIPEAPGFSLTVSPGQATFPGGSKSGCVGVTVVHGDKVPMAPGFGQQPRFIVTIQPSGTMFNPPAAMTLPNVDGLQPRAVTEMYSFDHDIGSFVAIGTGIVSDDGLVIRSAQGVGVLKAGWHCGGDPNTTGGAAICPVCFFCPGSLSACQPQGNGTACGNGGHCEFGKGCVGGNPCPTGYALNSEGKCCQGDDCDDASCPPGQHPDPITGFCENDGSCPPGWKANAAGQCCLNNICQCPEGQILNPATGSCTTYVDRCTPQTAGQSCNAGAGSAAPGTCDANGNCEGDSPDQCGPSSGCSACTTTSSGEQRCTACSNGQTPVNGRCEGRVRRLVVWTKAFIPYDKFGPLSLIDSATWPLDPVALLPTFGFVPKLSELYMLGDGRSFSADRGASYRTRQIAAFELDTNTLSQVGDASRSHLEDHASGAVIESVTPPLSGHPVNVSYSGETVVFTFSQSARLGFVTFFDVGLPLVPAIDLSLTVTFDLATRRYRVSGTHDSFPAYEIYVEVDGEPAQRLYQHDPGPIGQWPLLILGLFYPEDVSVNSSWNPF